MTDAVTFHGVMKRYPHFALTDCSFTLPAGRIMGFIGANGAGKSTTLRLLMGMLRADAGEIRVLGHDIPGASARAKREIGYTAEDLRLHGAATVAWHMAFMRSVRPTWDQRYAEQLAERFALPPTQRVKGLSHGQRVKAALLLALAWRPRLLVLDEPTTGLDPVARREVLGALMEVLEDESRSVLFSSQHTGDVEQISDLVTFIDRGRIVASDDKEAYLERWRRLRLEVPDGAVLPPLPGVVERSGGGHLATLVTERFDAAMPAALQAAGITVHGVERLTLEEIFVATVMARREGVAA